MSIVEEFSKYVVELNFAKLPKEILEVDPIVRTG